MAEEIHNPPDADNRAAQPPLVSFIMSGGAGARLWPLSRQDFPKQFHNFSGKSSMLARTVSRLNFINRQDKAGRVCGNSAAKSAKMPVYCIACENHAALLKQELSALSLHGGKPIFEPLGRNTAAAVALAAQYTLQNYGDTLVLIVPSDHEIETDEQFWQTIHDGIPAAQAGNVVVFGIKPDRAETGYGYIEITPASETPSSPEASPSAHYTQSASAKGEAFCNVRRFVEKPDLQTAERYVQDGNFLWNSGIFLFSAKIMQQAFDRFAPAINSATAQALAKAQDSSSGLRLSFEDYKTVPANSVDYAIMERISNIALVPARFRWNDLGSWQSLLDMPGARQNRDKAGNLIRGDVIAIDCRRSYLRSESGLLAAVGVHDMAVVATADATFIAPVSQSQNVRKIVAALETSGRPETKFTPSDSRAPIIGAYKNRLHSWLFDEALPLWSAQGVDDRGGFYEALNFDGKPLHIDKRMRTQARQVYSFAIAWQRSGQEPYRQLVRHGLDFIEKGRTDLGGFIAVFDADNHIKDTTEDLYDQSFVLLALAHAAACGEQRALQLGQESFAFLDTYLADRRDDSSHYMGYFETRENNRPLRRANPHMHLLETCLAWHEVTGEEIFLHRAANIVNLFQTRFFDRDNWALGEYFTADWKQAPGAEGNICEPGHHFEWAALLAAFDRHKTAAKKRQREGAIITDATEVSAIKEGANNADAENGGIVRMARKLYASAAAYGLNRATGLAYNSISRFGMPLDCATRSWQQTEIIKAAIALDCNQGPDLKPEVESRAARLFRRHIDAAPKGLWIDAIDEHGRALSQSVPASIFYHLITALTHYMDYMDFAENLDKKSI